MGEQNTKISDVDRTCMLLLEGDVMLKKLMLLIVLLPLFSCRPTPFKVAQLSKKDVSHVKSADRRLIDDFEGVLNDGLRIRYKRAKSPSFALINGYYHLPSTKPFGSASIVRKFSYQTYYEAVEVKEDEKAYAIEPISGDDAIALSVAVNSLLDIGVKIKEISMSDALAIAQAENVAAKENKVFKPKNTLPPQVDYLISIYHARSVQGPVLIGRVIKADGNLMAFRVLHRGVHADMVSGLITSLFEDTISRI